MDALHIDDLASRGLAGPCRDPLPRSIAGRVGASMLALATGVAMAAGGHHEPELIKPQPATAGGVAAKHGASNPAAPHRVSARVASGQVQPALPMMAPAASAPDTAVSEQTAPSALDALTGHLRPPILPALSDEIRLAALQEGKRLRSMAPMAAPALALVAQPVAVASTAANAPAKVPLDNAVAYALVTDITRTRVASELRQQLMGSSATVGELPGTPRTDLMQVSAGWRAVVWPFATEPEAAKARRLLAERGIRTELLKF